MKKYKYIIVALLITMFITSCEEDFLDVVPDDVSTIENTFINKAGADQYLATAYASLPNPDDKNQGNVELTGGDEVWFSTLPASSGYYNGAGMLIARGNQSSSNIIFDKWTAGRKESYYVGISNSYVFLNNIDAVLEIPEAERLQLKAEAKALVAFYHFYLIRMYGPIVVVNDFISASEGDTDASRATIDESFKFVLDLLDEAIVDLPTTNIIGGRISKVVAASMKARVAMTYASPLYNGNTALSSFMNADGELYFPTEDISKWDIAAKACKEAIDLCESAGIRLYNNSDFNYYDKPEELEPLTLLKGVLRGRVTDEANGRGPELIWGSFNDSRKQLQARAFPLLRSDRHNWTGSHSPTLRMAETYYTENGVPINEDVNFDYANRYNTKIADVTETSRIELGQETAILHFDREARFYSDLAFDRGEWYGSRSDKDQASVSYVHDRYKEYSGVEGAQAGDASSVTGYWPKKLVALATLRPQENGSTYSAANYGFPVIRLSDLYLYYAEALNEFKGAPDASVYEYIDRIRARAGLDGVVSSWSNFSSIPAKPATKEGMRSIIRQERMIEMSFEGTRFWDLRRWKLAKEMMNNIPIRGWNIYDSSAEGYYNVLNVHFQKFSEKDYFWPLPEAQVSKYPDIVQNPGW